MAIFPGTSITPAGAAGGGSIYDYTIDQSLRFDRASSTYLYRNLSSNRQTWTFSYWIKLCDLSISHDIISVNTGGRHRIIHKSDGRLETYSSSDNSELVTTQVFRDPSAWYHVVFVMDTTQATASNRTRIYVNGEQVTAFDSAVYSSQNTSLPLGSGGTTWIGYMGQDPTFLSGYLAEMHWIDGQALDPSYFGETDSTYGVWKPIEYTGSYGSGGFYLPFSGTFYNDASGNGNNWTANNLATTDVVLDSPTNNFCTFNSAAKSSYIALKEGNLAVDWSTNAEGGAASTFEMFDGSYVEFCVLSTSGSYPYPNFGIRNLDDLGQDNTRYNEGGFIYNTANDVRLIGSPVGISLNGSPSSVTYSVGDIVQVAYKDGKVFFGKNNTWMNSGDPVSGTGQIFNIAAGTKIDIAIRIYDTSEAIANFGQDSSFAGNKTAQNNTDANGYGDFYYSPPSGFLALCTANLSDPAVVPGENFNTVLYTGNDSTQSITGVGFQPDFLWIKDRNTGQQHALSNAISGAGKHLSSSLTREEVTSGSGQDLTSFDSDGFSLGSSNYDQFNYNGTTYVAWNWKADNTSGSTNTDGSITSTVAANVDAGFSIVAWTANGNSSATVGHGLSQKPDIYIRKRRDSTSDWYVHTDLIDGTPDYLALNLTDAQQAGSALATSTTFPADTGSTATHISYCFHSVDGYSKFGSYTGNGSTDGPFVYCGFRPAFIMVKRTDSTGSWYLLDSARDTYNIVDLRLVADGYYTESAWVTVGFDFVSNGIKVKTSESELNASGGTYIYMAFAEYPFKFSTAR